MVDHVLTFYWYFKFYLNLFAFDISLLINTLAYLNTEDKTSILAVDV